ncbi:MAG: penicillin binding transpeptidase domain protein [Fibrobacteria bacterium]|nr:penicillin binding transpeptidase domain protein [Fibrobacteria bacterium]
MPHSEPPRNKPDSLLTPHKPGGLRFDPVSPSAPPPSRPGETRPLPSSWPQSPARIKRRKRRNRLVLLTLIVLAAGAGWVAFFSEPPGGEAPPPGAILEMDGAGALPPPLSFPDQDTFATSDGRWVTRYAPDLSLQARTVRYLDQYRPEGAVIAIADLRTGQIRALAERDSGVTSTRPKLALGNSFPAASLAKIITAAAALEGGVCRPDDGLPLLGGAHTLYRSQLRTPASGAYNTVSLREAFARSINPTFGILGMQVGPASLRRMGERLGFNRPTAAGEAFIGSSFHVPDSGFELAEVACGYTTTTTISPLHALQIARAIGDDGRVLPGRFTRELVSLDGEETRRLPAPEAEPFTSAAALVSLKSLMEATVSAGTARRGFRRNLSAQEFEALEMGGKTGSLNGHNPPGRYEWFIGYARRKDHPDQGIAVAVMLINRTYLAVHATELAGLVIRDWLRYSAPYPDEDGSHLAER